MTIDAHALSGSRRPGWMSALAILLVFRIGLFAFVYLARALVDLPHPHGNTYPGNLFLDGWVQWDSEWYSRIASHGYTNVPNAAGERDTAFFPLLPMLARLLGHVIGDVNLSGLLICNAAFLVAGMLIYQFARQWLDEPTALRAIVLLCVWPGAYVFSAFYAESLLLLASVGMFAAARRRWWLIAALCAAAGGATRPPGILLTPALILTYMQDMRWRPKWDILYTLLGVCGVGGYTIYLWIRFDDPFAMMRAQGAAMWGGHSSITSLVRLFHDTANATFSQIASGDLTLVDLLQVGLLIIAAAMAIAMWRKLPWVCSAWATAALALAWMRWISGARQAAVIFPLFIATGSVLRGRYFYAVVYISTLLLALATFLFCQSQWIG
ncbi:MAG: glycosyltransferase family 39 protein [Phycisphaerae bacterium]|nr:glycosyltransferase family 39 protein [Phycisphaerae bacterium]